MGLLRTLLCIYTARAFSLNEVEGFTRDSPCSGTGVGKEDCLTRGPCMYLEFADAPARCTVCEFDGSAIPCVPVGGVYAGHTVNQCAMQCAHQEIQQIVSPCEDTTGDATLSQCQSKGLSAFTKCMWTQEGFTKGFCGPCSVAGVGTVSCPPGGAVGMSGAPVTMCVSQCDEPCPPMFPGCNSNTPPPPALLNGPVPLKVLGVAMSDEAPDYKAVKVLPPYGKQEYEDAGRIAAQAAGWGPDTLAVPSAPMAIFGPPPPFNAPIPPDMPVLYGPAAPGIIGAPPPGYGFGTAPPPAMVAAAGKQFLFIQKEKQRFLEKEDEKKSLPRLRATLRKLSRN